MQEESLNLWNPTFNAALDMIDKHDRDNGVGQFSSTNNLPMKFT